MNKKTLQLIALILSLRGTVLYTGEPDFDTKYSLNEATVFIHTYPAYSSTQPLLSNSSSSQSDQSASTASTSPEQEVKQECDTFTENLFPGLQPLQISTRNISDLTEKEIKAYKELYMKMLTTLLPYFPESEAPGNIRSLRPVTDEQSYTVYVFERMETDDKDKYFNIFNRVSPRNSYDIQIPLFKPEEEGNLDYTPPHSTEEAYGFMANSLADFTSFRLERRMVLRRKLEKMRNYILVFSFIGTTAYWMLYDKDHHASSGQKAGDFFKNLALHAAGEIILTYPIHILDAYKKRKDQRFNTQSVIENTPLVADVHPLVIGLARKYASQNFTAGLKTLEYTDGICCWIWCCPVFLGIKRLLAIPLKEMPETTRITMLLEGSYQKLQKKLHNEGIPQPNIVAAHRVQKKYADILDGLYPLNEHHLDTMVTRTNAMELNQRKRNYLISIIRNSREKLKNCLPAHIKNKAESQDY